MADSDGGFKLSGDNHSTNSIGGTGGNNGIAAPAWSTTLPPSEQFAASPSNSSFLNPVTVGLGAIALLSLAALLFRRSK